MIAIADSRFSRCLAPALLALALALPGVRPSSAAAAQRTYASPEEAALALVEAVKIQDHARVLAVLGADAEPLLRSGDPVADANARDRFLESWEEAHSVVAGEDGEMVLQVGADDWQFPIPLVKADAGWRFDAVAGKEEVLARRIGANELATIQACLAYVDAQREYYDRNPEGDSLLHYAQKLSSSPGKRDGLSWESGVDEEESPLGLLFAGGRGEGYEMKGKGAPFHGYHFRILTAQGPAAVGGAYDYIAQGKMIGGFALIASPAKWDNSGIMTFVANHDGVVFQKDLGPDTAAEANATKTFNPDDTWTRVEGVALAVDTDS